jgi:DNA processing protein
LIQSKENYTKLRTLLNVEGIGPNKLITLVNKFKSLDNLFDSSLSSLIQVEGISIELANRILRKIDESQNELNTTIIELENLNKINAKWLTFWSEDYPTNLKNIFGPPIILYFKGNLKQCDKNSIAVVGTRSSTKYGKSVAEILTKELVKNGLTIVSGLARGIDSVAHKSAIENGGRTFAIIGSGLDVIYPSENKKLFDQISENGCVISEYKLGTKPDAINFPKRNRIISGISLGTVVIESRITGGALQTAAYALNQNREVFAIPGNIGSLQSEGTNTLIQKGEAKLVKNAEDILVELNIKIKPEVGKNIPKPSYDLNLFEQKIYELLSNEPKHIDEIAKESEINSSECLVHLLSLEFRDIVKQLPGKNFILS